MVRQAVLLNQTYSPAPGWSRLAGLPLLLRAVLTAQRAGIEEILIVGGQDPQSLLARDRRVQVVWRWVPLESSEADSEIKALERVAPELKENFIVFFSDSIFDAAALNFLQGVSLDGRLAVVGLAPGRTDGFEQASLYVCTPEFVRQAGQAEAPAGRPQRLGEAAARLRERGVEVLEIPGRVWPRTSERKRLRAILWELSRVNLKPSDGFYARFNKLYLAQPLIRLFLRTPATPNFITGLGLVLGLAAGVVFAHGGYWWSVLGASLWFLSALMDHADGMVARLKFMESEFGTWFESWVDYISTFSAYIGLTIGLYRETGFAHHLVVGGLFVFGAIMIFITQSQQRKRLSPDNPADYPNRMHRKLEEHSSNLFLWFARKAYFVARRAVLPYWMLFFCLLDLRVLFVGWSALGAHLMWIFTLYSNRHIRPEAPPAPAD
ncbi:MAG: CDP-alcohol phosphatidyltransferase family protein [Candidatus Acidiferrales bacterium]